MAYGDDPKIVKKENFCDSSMVSISTVSANFESGANSEVFSMEDIFSVPGEEDTR
jgi:hypothetical protein